MNQVNTTEAGNPPQTNLNLYVEIASQIIYEVKLFETFVLARPATPELFNAVRKIELYTFGREFEDFLGDRDEVYGHLTGTDPCVLLASTKH